MLSVLFLTSHLKKRETPLSFPTCFTCFLCLCFALATELLLFAGPCPCINSWISKSSPRSQSRETNPSKSFWSGFFVYWSWDVCYLFIYFHLLCFFGSVSEGEGERREIPIWWTCCSWSSASWVSLLTCSFFSRYFFFFYPNISFSISYFFFWVIWNFVVSSINIYFFSNQRDINFK